jgi:hypothetical protein
MILMKTKANGHSATEVYTVEMRDTAAEVTTFAEQIAHSKGRSAARTNSPLR